jgi:hypothetical protein
VHVRCMRAMRPFAAAATTTTGDRTCALWDLQR